MIFRAAASIIVFCYAKLFFRLRVVGKEKVPRGAVIIAVNHASFLDPPLLGAVMWPDVPFFLARGTLFQTAFGRWLLRECRALPIKRGEENAALFRQVIKAIEEGYKVALFPEGTRTKDGKMREALPGIGLLVRRAGCPVVPVYIEGTYEAWNCHQRRPKLWGRMTLVFGDPIDFVQKEGERKQVQREIGGEIMKAIAALKERHDATRCD